MTVNVKLDSLTITEAQALRGVIVKAFVAERNTQILDATDHLRIIVRSYNYGQRNECVKQQTAVFVVSMGVATKKKEKEINNNNNKRTSKVRVPWPRRS